MLDGLALERHGVLYGSQGLPPFGASQFLERPSARHNGIGNPAPHGTRHSFKLPEAYGAKSLRLLILMDRLGR